MKIREITAKRMDNTFKIDLFIFIFPYLFSQHKLYQKKGEVNSFFFNLWPFYAKICFYEILYLGFGLCHE